MQTDVRALAQALGTARQKRLLVITGAGISLASGIPTYRGTDPGAVWKTEVTELGTQRYFQRDPVTWWKWILGLADQVAAAKPNPAHYAVAALERWQSAAGGGFLLVTQNIDTLHEQAGSIELVKVHGSADRVRCSREGCRYGAPAGSLPGKDFDMRPFLEDPKLATLPRCPACDSLLRAHALLFDEYYTGHADYQFPRVEKAVAEMDLGLSIGTSFSVGVTDLVLRSALSRRVPILSIDPAAPQHRALHGQVIQRKAEDILPGVCQELGIEVERLDGESGLAG